MDAEVPALLGVNRSVLGRRWMARPCDDAQLRAMTQNGMSELLARILAGRGVRAEESDSYLEPRLRDLMPDPFCLTDMEEAVECLLDAVACGRKIAVFADYDADGATSCALLQRYLGALGVEVRAYIPDRMLEGYGPSEEAFAQLHKEGIEVVVLVDCGASAHVPLEFAKEKGLEVLVLDHHKCPEGDLPPTRALVNPKRSDDDSGLDYLASAGVVFLLLVACNRALRTRGKEGPDLKELLDLVALATICDMTPLVALNRAFVRGGVRVLRCGGNPGLRALAREAGVEGGNIGAQAFGFVLGPRINAAGRIGQSDLAVRLLFTDDPEEACALAMKLSQLNRERQFIEAQVMEQAAHQVESRQGQHDSVVVAWDKRWHPGVVGIVANRLKERYWRASAVMGEGKEEGMLRGSCRSVAGFDMGEAVLAAVNEGILLSGGGHAMAAGFSLEESRVEEFHAFLCERCENSDASESEPYYLDGVLGLRAADVAAHDLLEKAGPYGKGNATPSFAFAGVRVVQSRFIGKAQDHISCILSGEDGGSLRAMAFRSVNTPMGEALWGDRRLHVAGRLDASEWRGSRRLRLLVEDVAECAESNSF